MISVDNQSNNSSRSATSVGARWDCFGKFSTSKTILDPGESVRWFHSRYDRVLLRRLEHTDHVLPSLDLRFLCGFDRSSSRRDRTDSPSIYNVGYISSCVCDFLFNSNRGVLKGTRGRRLAPLVRLFNNTSVLSANIPLHKRSTFTCAWTVCLNFLSSYALGHIRTVRNDKLTETNSPLLTII